MGTDHVDPASPPQGVSSGYDRPLGPRGRGHPGDLDGTSHGSADVKFKTPGAVPPLSRHPPNIAALSAGRKPEAYNPKTMAFSQYVEASRRTLRSSDCLDKTVSNSC